MLINRSYYLMSLLINNFYKYYDTTLV